MSSHGRAALPDDDAWMPRDRIAPRGEMRLALAVLVDAMRCLKERPHTWNVPPRLFRWEAEQWIESRDREAVFSFENTCSILCLDADAIRRRIRLWREQRPEESASGI
jgi:hypothetical protein